MSAAPIRILSHALRRAEVKDRTLNAHSFPGRERSRAVLEALVGKELQLMAVHGAGTVEVEVAVVREVAERVAIRFGAVVELQCAAAQTVCHTHGELSGEALLAVRRDAGEFYAILHRLCRPDEGIKAAHTAVEAVGTIVFGERVLFAVERKRGSADAVADAADAGAEVAIVRLVLGERVVAEYGVSPNAVAADRKGADRCTVGDHRNGKVLIAERIFLHALAAHRRPEGLRFQ